MEFVFGKKEELVEKIAKKISFIINSEESPKLILPTGNSPIDIYSRLVEYHKSNKLSFKKVKTFNLDEYLYLNEGTIDLSFEKFMNDNLFSKVDIKKENINFPTENVNDYNDKLDGLKSIDLALVGVGVNGHIAFNEPGTDFNTRTHLVELTESTIKVNFGTRKNFPTKAVTMGLTDIYNKSKIIILIAWGESKREALVKLKSGKVDVNWPITNFWNHPNFIVYTDLIDL